MGKVFWRARISQGIWVCSGCGAEMVEPQDDDGGVIFGCSDGCPQVAALRRGQQ